MQGKKGLENKSGGARKRKPDLSMHAREIIFNYDHWDIGNLTVNEISRKLRISAQHLSKTFRKVTGFKLSDFSLKQKMYVCSVLLVQKSELTVKKIVETIGFCSDFPSFRGIKFIEALKYFFVTYQF